MPGDSNRSTYVSIHNQTHDNIKYFLTMTGTITSENIDLFFWITLYQKLKKSDNIRKCKVAGTYFKVRKYETLQQNNIYNRRIKEYSKACSECVKGHRMRCSNPGDWGTQEQGFREKLIGDHIFGDQGSKWVVVRRRGRGSVRIWQ